MKQEFTKKELLKYYTSNDRLNSIIVDENKLERVCNSIYNETFKLPIFKVYNSVLLSNSIDFEYILVLRKLNDNIRRLYKIKHNNRDLIINQIRVLFEETSRPISIIRLDIVKFYNNIDKSYLLNKIINKDNLLSYHSKLVLTTIFQKSKNKLLTKNKGLPFGLNLSATLSELFLRNFDEKINQSSNIYYYSRYVDDILIFSYQKDDIRSELDRYLPKSLSIHKKSKNSFEVIESSINKIDYLGYHFCLCSNSKMLVIKISENKINKIKSRIVYSFVDYFRNKDYKLLKNRIKFLTGNYRVYKNNSIIKIGIYYNYKHITTIEQLEKLSLFLRSIIFAKNGKFGQKIDHLLTMKQKKELAKYSFENGFKEKIIHNFNFTKIREITKCWKYEE